MPDPGLNGAAIGGDAIAEVCITKTERLCEGILELEDRDHSAETSVIAITSSELKPPYNCAQVDYHDIVAVASQSCR